jgi:hypothetical protein
VRLAGRSLGLDMCCELMGVALPIVHLEKLLGRHMLMSS